jgi:prepilin-type processing-associated H-X9-DG protein
MGGYAPGAASASPNQPQDTRVNFETSDCPNIPSITKMSQITSPLPVNALVFIDESVNTVDDGFFVVQIGSIPNTMDGWDNSPTARHSNGATLSFADGHVERWGWKGITTEQKPWTVIAQPNDMIRLQNAIWQQ